jgi:hypothetical protein
MSGPGAIDAYLESASEAKLLGLVHGRPYVAGVCHDPVTGEQLGLAEYCDPWLLHHHAWCLELGRRLAAQFADADLLILRARSAADLPAPWTPMVSYVRYCGERPDNGDGDPDVAVVVAGPAHVRFIEDRLHAAISAGYACQERQVNESAARRAAREFAAAPDRLSYVAIVAGRPVGHLTMLTGACDEVTGEDYLDLVDMLVDQGEFASRARAALVRAAVSHAVTAGRPLIGNVTHPGGGSASGRKIVNSLLTQQWRVDHADWRWSGP